MHPAPGAPASVDPGKHRACFLRATNVQENYFFDGARGELSSTRTVLRVRIYGGTEKATLTLKGKAAVVDGVSRAMEVGAFAS